LNPLTLEEAAEKTKGTKHLWIYIYKTGANTYDLCIDSIVLRKYSILGRNFETLEELLKRLNSLIKNHYGEK